MNVLDRKINKLLDGNKDALQESTITKQEEDPMTPWYIQTEQLINENKIWRKIYGKLDLKLKWKIIQEATFEIQNKEMENIFEINDFIISKLEEIYENKDSFWKEFKENELSSEKQTNGTQDGIGNKFNEEDEDKEEEELEEDEICTKTRNEIQILGKSMTKWLNKSGNEK